MTIDEALKAMRAALPQSSHAVNVIVWDHADKSSYRREVSYRVSAVPGIASSCSTGQGVNLQAAVDDLFLPARSSATMADAQQHADEVTPPVECPATCSGACCVADEPHNPCDGNHGGESCGQQCWQNGAEDDLEYTRRIPGRIL